MSAHDDFASEPVPDLPARPPVGEEILWQGRPNSFALARDAYKITWFAGYFVALAIWRATTIGFTLVEGLLVTVPYLVIGLVFCGILYLVAVLQARSTLYTVTTARVAMRIGAALSVTLNIPYKQLANANLALGKGGVGSIALDTMGDTTISYLVCWPHVRPWRLAKTQPMLRCIPDASRVANLLADAAQTRLNQPEVTMAHHGLTLSAAESPMSMTYARPSDDPDKIPTPLLRAILVLVLATLALVSYAVYSGRPHEGVPKSAQVVQERSIIQQGGGAQAVTVLDADGKVLMDLPHGGFITVIQNAMERARLTAGVDKLLPLRIVKYANGRLAAVDDASGWSAELGAFGSDNRAAFERLMSQN